MSTTHKALCGQGCFPGVGCAGCCYDQNIQTGPVEWDRIFHFIQSNKDRSYIEDLKKRARAQLATIDSSIVELTNTETYEINRATHVIGEFFNRRSGSLRADRNLIEQIILKLDGSRSPRKVHFQEALSLTTTYFNHINQQNPENVLTTLPDELLDTLKRSLELQLEDFHLNPLTRRVGFGQKLDEFLGTRLGALLTPVPRANPCVFLDPRTNRCTVYSVRPSICDAAGKYTANVYSNGCSPNLMFQSLYGSPLVPADKDYFFRLLKIDLPLVPVIVRVLTSQF